MEIQEYRKAFEECRLTTIPKQIQELKDVCRIALLHQQVYLGVQQRTKIPWPLVATIHFRESSQSFKRHLHNGDPLTARTVHIPPGRPATGEPPFTWVESAADAFSQVWRPSHWGVEKSLEFLERFNGLGYRKRGINSPYLWNYTDRYGAGLFTSDGKFDRFKVEERPGCVAMLKTLRAMGVSIDFSGFQTTQHVFH